MNLDHLIVNEMFAIFLVFCRVGTAIMLMPTVGESYVSPRVRLLFSLAFSFLLAQVIGETLPKAPASIFTVFVLAFGEIVIGALMGMITKIFLSTMHIAGMAIASQSGIASAMLFDPSQGTQSAAVGVFMTLTATLMFFSLDLHHIMLGAFADSYNIFKTGDPLAFGDMSNYITRAIADAFSLGVRISAPVMVVAMFLNIAGGVMSRLMPQMSVFFIIMPVQLALSFAVMMITTSSIFLWYADSAQEVFTNLLTK